MSLWRIAWRSIQQRGLASVLTAVSMALGVTLVVAVLTIHSVVFQSFQSNTSLGYNMIVGGKGGALQLALNTVFYLSKPLEPIPYDYYMEFLPAERRDAAAQLSLQYQASDALAKSQTLSALAASRAGGGLGGLTELVTAIAVDERHQQNAQYTPCFQRPVAPLRMGSRGKFAHLTALAIPLCLGDFYGRFRVVATTPDFFDKLRFGPSADQPFEFAAGRNFQTRSEENGFFEAVVGWTVAQEMHVQVGDRVSPVHGAAQGEGSEHAEKFRCVGILGRTGTPNDRVLFINMEGFYLMSDHAKPIERADTQGKLFGDSVPRSVSSQSKDQPLAVEEREVTAILVRTASALVADPMANIINEEPVAQAVFPYAEIFSLFSGIVDPIQRTLLLLTVLICIVSGISILVSIYNSMSERRYEIAVMRALGADRGTVMVVILLEAVMLSVGGGLCGWLFAHSMIGLANPILEERTGVAMGFFSFSLGESLLIPGLIALAVAVGFLPAVAAYRTDVARSLGK